MSLAFFVALTVQLSTGGAGMCNGLEVRTSRPSLESSVLVVFILTGLSSQTAPLQKLGLSWRFLLLLFFLTTWGPPWGKTLTDPKHLLLIRVSLIPELDCQMKNTSGPETSQDQHLDQQAGGPTEQCNSRTPVWAPPHFGLGLV